MSDFDRRRDIEAEGQRATMVPSKPDLSNMGKGTAYKIGYRQGHADAISAAMQLPEVRALVDALERIAHASDIYGVEANAEDQGAGTLAYAHKSTCNLARAALAPFTEAKP